MKIGLFGGTFNPPHNTHVNIVKQALKQLELDKLLIVPNGTPPHKFSDLDKLTRLKLTHIAFDGIATNAEIWDYEIVKDGASYTVETLREAKRINPQAELYLIIGGDSLIDFNKWYRPDEIASLATLAVAERSSKISADVIDEVKNRYNAKAVFLDVDINDVSSSEIRLRYQFGKDNSAVVPCSVDAYIKENGLYLQYRAMATKLKTYLKPERYEHTFYVIKRGLEFANKDNYNKVFTACLLHDCAKYISEKDYAKYGFVKPDNMPEPVVHSFLGALVAERDFGINDCEILDAIKYHTTGRPNMTELEKIVYIADKTEQTRPYPLEHLLSGPLHEIFVKCLAEANEYRMQAHGDADFPLTDETLAFYLK